MTLLQQTVDDYIQHLSRCNDERLCGKMLNIPRYEICVPSLSFLHDDLIKYAVFRIRQINIKLSRINIDPC